MVYKLIESGPFRGLPAIHVAPSDLEGAAFLQEVTGKLLKAIELLGIGAKKKHIVFQEVDKMHFEKTLSLVRLLKYHGWFPVAEGSSQKLSPAAGEFQSYVAHHYAEDGDTWLNYPCGGFVLHGVSCAPVFTANTEQVPKFIYGKIPEDLVLNYMKKSEYPWSYEPMFSGSTEVKL